MNFNFNADTALQTLSAGAFLTSQAEGRLNSMTISWGAMGIMWNKPVFVALVRGTRFTHGLIEKSGEFTVSLPTEDMKKALNLCGVVSGSKMDKIKEAALATVPGKAVATPRIDCKGTHYECKVLFKNVMSAQNLDSTVKDKWYHDNNYHTFYFAEIVHTEVV